jgi:hypothetical protein
VHAHCQPNPLHPTDAGRRIHTATHAAGDFIKLYWANMTQANKELFGHVNEFVAGSFSALNVKEHYLGMSGGCIFTADEWIQWITGGAIQNDTELREVHDSRHFPWELWGLSAYCRCATAECTKECKEDLRGQSGVFNQHKAHRGTANFTTYQCMRAPRRFAQPRAEEAWGSRGRTGRRSR